VLFIGESPGFDDDTPGKLSFTGQAGREWNENYLQLAGFQRNQVRFVNVVRCRPPVQRKITDKEIEACSRQFLPDELERCQPKIVVLMGARACSLIPDIKLDIEHGIPRPGITKLFGWRGVVVPMYHPAHSLHDTGMMIPLLEDFKRLREVVMGKWKAPKDTQLCDYRVGMNGHEAFPLYGRIAIDTETHQGKLWSVQYSYEPGTATMIKVNEPAQFMANLTGEPLLRHLNVILRATHPTLVPVFHNASADMEVLRLAGINISTFQDTMQEAYHLGNLPQGLKGLAYRLLGIRMRTWEDVVFPHSRAAINGWMLQALEYATDNLATVTRKEYKRPKRDGTTHKDIVKAGKIESALRRMIVCAEKNDEYKVWEKLDELHQVCSLDAVEREVGPRPLMGIAHTPEKEAVAYGCGDADITLRVAMELEKIRQNKVQDMAGEWYIAPEDRDK
jgi:uracil-DNA glycosylase family 4